MIFSTLMMSGIPIVVLRDDLNHPFVSGNKLHKLAPNIEQAKVRKCSTVLSFGGPYSNHLHALAWACHNKGLASIGVVRGELHEKLTPTLRDCKSWGMTLVPSSRKDYRKNQTILATHASPCLASEVAIQLPLGTPLNNTLIIPEGGSNAAAIESLSLAYSQAFTRSECQDITHVVCATGTGATLAGILNATPAHVNVLGIQVVAEGQATTDRIQQWLGIKDKKLNIEPGHLGGFGKTPFQLLEFINDFEAEHNIPLDQIYNGKAMFTLTKKIAEKGFKPTDKILFIHTGGLQGKRKD
jgi:1-aminocyclopropane-1-carboxylate deaminase